MIKKIYFIIFFYFTCCIGHAQYNIQVDIKQMAGKNIILANYFEGKVYAVDTAKLDISGKGAFRKTDRKLAKGLYLLLFSPSNYFDLIIGNNQNFSIQTDTVNTLENTDFKNSPENQAFLELQKYMTSQGQKSKQINDNISQESDPKAPAIQKKYQQQFEQLDQEVREYVAGICQKYPGSALATFANFTLTPKIPDFSKEIPEATPDRDREIQKRGYFYKKAHYWDYTNFKDSTLLRTPFFKSKLEEYFNDMVLIHPDSVYKEAVYLIEKSRSCKAMFRYIVSYCFNYSVGSNIMGMETAFVNLAKRYYLSGDANWISKEDKEKIEKEVALSQYNLLGLNAQELKLPTLEGEWVSLHETEAPFTLLLFWESDCGHCKKQVPEVKTLLLDKFKPYGFKVFAVHSQNEKEKWEKFVAEYDLFDFINCWDPHNQSNFRIFYHITSTPKMYLLDKKKKIIAKDIQISQFVEILINEYKKMGINVK